jgi:hypothetical protein
MACPTIRSLFAVTLVAKSSACGGSASLKSDWPDWTSAPARVVPGFFPPELVVQVKALACELPVTHGVPLSHWNTPDIARQVCNAGLIATISGSTIWRWLHEDAIRPWYHRSWIFPRDPVFAVKANRILDLYERSWQGKPLKTDEFVISADEKTNIQAKAPQASNLACCARAPDARRT